jgi:hypothetical protein
MNKLKFVAAIVVVGGGLSMGAVDARGANFDGEDIVTPGGTFVEDVFDTRFERDGGRDSDLDICNDGRADYIDARGRNSADINDPANCNI